MKNIGKFLCSKWTLGSLLVVLFYGMCMVGIYFSGYKVVPKKLNNLPVAVVNQDTQSYKLKKQLVRQLPFKHVKYHYSLKKAKEKLRNKKIYLIVDIPTNFQKNVTKGEKANLHFYVNEANPMTAVSGMENVANTIGATVENKITQKRGKAIFTAVQLKQLKAQLTKAVQESPQQAQAIQTKGTTTAKGIKRQANNLYSPQNGGISYKLHKINKVKSGMNHTMAPFFLSLAFYIGSMIGALVLYLSFSEFVYKVGKLKTYGLSELAMLLIAIIAPVCILGIATWLNNFSSTEFMNLWLSHGLELFAAMNFNFIFNLLLGQLGIMINVPIMMIQIVSGAGLIPKLILPPFFKFMSIISPTYYAIQADFSILGDRLDIGHHLISLIYLSVVTIIISLCIVIFKKYNKKIGESKQLI
ncbi:YhgE/Pip domain-containing protein [Liquorilactobacillus mali]|uniref:YhgE/Pip domain-containing protein n=1 Tax=Liquorilactobacillus mali TaxID=1618 RepID=UPI0023502ED9|nr:ABC transporter permease [Liquorilactobacillus mali]MDC7952550.1 ABC transporter permease [Liquorilactobacillus mali]